MRPGSTKLVYKILIWPRKRIASLCFLCRRYKKRPINLEPESIYIWGKNIRKKQLTYLQYPEILFPAFSSKSQIDFACWATLFPFFVMINKLSNYIWNTSIIGCSYSLFILIAPYRQHSTLWNIKPFTFLKFY